MSTKESGISKYARASIANHAVALLSACDWQVDVAHEAVESMRTIANLHERGGSTGESEAGEGKMPT